MKIILKKTVALLLAVVMAFGALPFAGYSLLAAAVAPVLEGVEIQPGTLTLNRLLST